MITLTLGQILNDAVCLFFCAKTFGKYEFNFSSSSYWRDVEEIGLFNFGIATGLEEEKS